MQALGPEPIVRVCEPLTCTAAGSGFWCKSFRPTPLDIYFGSPTGLDLIYQGASIDPIG